jgi:hypothetical protein
LALAFSGSTAFGQCLPCNPFCCPPVRVAACYQTVPVTEMRECRQTVQRPKIETKIVEQPVTEYRQVVETKSAEVPTCTYQNVTEMRSVQRDCGGWVTQTHCRPQMTPCQYDNRPDLFGFINRTGFAVRMAFTPQQWNERVYVPNVVTTQVPVTRQVAVRGTQTVNYQVARMVPVTTTRKVAINTVRMVSEEIVTRQPVVVFKTVPFGSSLAQGVPANSQSSTSTAFRPAPESKATAIMPKNSGGNTKISKLMNDDLQQPDDGVERGSSGGDKSSKKPAGSTGEQGSIRIPASNENDLPGDAGSATEDQEYARQERPIGRWVARKRNKPQLISGPNIPELAQFEAKKK